MGNTLKVRIQKPERWNALLGRLERRGLLIADPEYLALDLQVGPPWTRFRPPRSNTGTAS